MADRRTRRGTGSELSLSRSTMTRATAIAEQLRFECSFLLELYTKKESIAADIADGRLVSVPPPSTQLDTSDTLWRLHSALLQCRGLLESAIAREDEHLGGGKKGDYENQRKMVKDRLTFLLNVIGEPLKAAGGSVATPTPYMQGLESGVSTGLFELKLWVYRIFKEVDYWAKTAITTLQALPPAKERPMRTTRVRSVRSARR
ncbi:uncharacterized protein [Clinocottus analis]|uniref:uncharacterized protein n=1 Tax=Clinocottus analis TaxID=304258 RepID=UPI0035BEFDC9